MKHAHHRSSTPDEWGAIVARLGGEAALAASARAHGAFLRPRAVRSAADLLRCALIYGPGGHSLRLGAAVVAEAGLADLSDVALLKRLSKAADWMAHLSARALGAPAAGRRVRVVDGSRLPGPGRSAWRLHLAYDPAAGRTLDLAVTSTRAGERLDRLRAGPDEVVLGDRGYPHPHGVKNTLEAGADVLVRLTWKSLRLLDDAGEPLDWAAVFAEATAAGGVDRPVWMDKARGPFEPVRLRLVVLPKPAEAAERAAKKARRTSRKDMRKATDPRTEAAARHLVLLTSLDAGVTPAELAGLYRLRWQVELAFKRMKSLLRLDRLPAKDEGLARTWIHAHLLVALVAEGLRDDAGAFPP